MSPSVQSTSPVFVDGLQCMRLVCYMNSLYRTT